MEIADKLYQDLGRLGVEVLFDDRGEKAGSMFSDADLLGIPLRAVISPKGIAGGSMEFKVRGSRDSELVPLDKAAEFLAAKVREEMAKYQ